MLKRCFLVAMPEPDGVDMRTQKRCIGYVAIVVDDYDRAIEYYTENSQSKRAMFTITRKKTPALTIGETQTLRGHLRCQAPVDNILNDFKSVNFIQSKKLRCMSRHQNPSMVSLHDGHLNLAQSGHYNFAITLLVRIMYIMLNALTIPLVHNHLRTTINHTLTPPPYSPC